MRVAHSYAKNGHQGISRNTVPDQEHPLPHIKADVDPKAVNWSRLENWTKSVHDHYKDNSGIAQGTVLAFLKLTTGIRSIFGESMTLQFTHNDFRHNAIFIDTVILFKFSSPKYCAWALRKALKSLSKNLRGRYRLGALGVSEWTIYKQNFRETRVNSTG
jgi:hypothetical protein